MDVLKLLALSGSLRKASYNTAAINALKLLAPDHVTISIGSIHELPLFNPDREQEAIPAVIRLATLLQQCDGLIIASPEYAHGISGPMKNALDWLVGGEEFPAKPIMLVNTSPRANYAQQALKEVLNTMSGSIIDQAQVSIPLLGSGLTTASDIIARREIADVLQAGVIEFCRQIVKLKLNKKVD